MAHLLQREVAQERWLHELRPIEAQEAAQEVAVLIAGPAHEAANRIGVPHQRQGALAVEVQVREAPATTEALAVAQEARLVTVVVVLQEGLRQEADLQAEGEGTKPIN